MRRRVLFFGVLVLLAACVRPQAPSGGGGGAPPALSPVPLGAGEKLRVVATTTIVGDVVAQVGGDAIQLVVLVPIGADAHTYEPRPSDLAVLSGAHVLFINGLGLEAFLERTLSSVGNIPVVSVSEGIQPRPLEAHGHEEGHESENEHEEVDPHVWTDVRNVMVWVENIQRALSTLDPGNASRYAANAAAYRKELEALDAWILEQVAQVPPQNRKLVTNHPTFGYFADRYGFEQMATVYPLSPASEPSAREIAELEETIRQFGIPAVFAETTVNPKLAEQVARDTGVRLVTLYTHSLGGPGSGAESYIAMMRYNVVAIVDALK
ncbi:MAG: metal ABC transporter substrate-binding protein [Anaerolineae bacterium]|nr:metal ABC transporter substrate-binding protein [Anaerolineae bacterium]